MQDVIGERQVILVTTKADVLHFGKQQTRENIFTLSWHMPVSFEPALYAIASGNTRFSTKLIKESQVFCVNFMPYQSQKDVLFCGTHSGESTDKFKESSLEKESCETIECSRIKSAHGYLECELVEEISAGDHTIFVGKVLKAVNLQDGNRLIQKNKSFTQTR